MIQNYFDNVKTFLGSLIPNTRAREGWGKGIYLFSFLKIIGSPAKRAWRAGKKKRGSGGNEFLPARPFWVVGGCASPSATHKSEFSVGVLFKISSDFVQKVPPFFRIRIFSDCCLALATLGLGKNEDFIGIFEIQKQFLPEQTEVRFAKGKHKFEKFINQSFFFRRRRKAKR